MDGTWNSMNTEACSIIPRTGRSPQHRQSAIDTEERQACRNVTRWLVVTSVNKSRSNVRTPTGPGFPNSIFGNSISFGIGAMPVGLARHQFIRNVVREPLALLSRTAYLRPPGNANN